ncbi:hypothetical protein HNP77_000412 [Treponema rectale]|uniref:Uncharacterized protein n=1 Tax=Treponema rectale TaxID=744512 RepID=A0A840SD04_9SPIR|nr:hypothetical protein [Treponema rectale]MBB5218068.1 hypothetical protein [Treponema rectale]
MKIKVFIMKNGISKESFYEREKFDKKKFKFTLDMGLKFNRFNSYLVIDNDSGKELLRS